MMLIIFRGACIWKEKGQIFLGFFNNPKSWNKTKMLKQPKFLNGGSSGFPFSDYWYLLVIFGILIKDQHFMIRILFIHSGLHLHLFLYWFSPTLITLQYHTMRNVLYMAMTEFKEVNCFLSTNILTFYIYHISFFHLHLKFFLRIHVWNKALWHCLVHVTDFTSCKSFSCCCMTLLYILLPNW